MGLMPYTSSLNLYWGRLKRSGEGEAQQSTLTALEEWSGVAWHGDSSQEHCGCWESSDSLGQLQGGKPVLLRGAVLVQPPSGRSSEQKVRLPWRRRSCCRGISVECRPLPPEGAPCVPRRWSDCPPSSLLLHTVGRRAPSIRAGSLECKPSPQCCHTETETILMAWRPHGAPGFPAIAGTWLA